MLIGAAVNKETLWLATSLFYEHSRLSHMCRLSDSDSLQGDNSDIHQVVKIDRNMRN